jgi:hypothetical protein
MATNTDPAQDAKTTENVPVEANGDGSDTIDPERDWTGYYTISILVLTTRIEAARAALPKGLRLDESYGSPNGSYPVLVSFGVIENAHPSKGSAIGFNYYEAFSAIPGVQLDQPKSGPPGPYLYPYCGYLNRLLPVVLGRLSGFRKFWERVSVVRWTGDSTRDGFTVKSLLSGNPIMDGQYTIEKKLGLAAPNPRVQHMQKLLAPNIVGVNPLGNLARSVFSLGFDKGVSWDISHAKLNLHDDFIPGIKGKIDIDYVKGAQTANTLVWTADDRYLPFRAFVPWRLISERELDTQIWTTLEP